MSFLDKIKSVFVVPESEESSNPGSVPDTRLKSETTNSSPSIPVSGLVESKEKFEEILSKVLEENNISGFDYLEYKKAVSSIAKLQNMDESSQYKTAYAAIMSMNIQPSHLIESAKKYLSILEAEFAKFNQTASQFLQNQIKTKGEESKLLQQSIEQMEKQLLQLQSELKQSQERLSVIDKEIQSANIKVQANKSSFSLAYNELVEQIQSDIQKMEQFLK